MENLVWRTPGADGGRDIEGETREIDISGSSVVRKWYVECKRYSSSLDWPTVRGKIAYAESNDADVILVATTANPSPNCETEITKWNKLKRPPLVRFWRGYDLPNIVRGVPHIATMFGVSDNPAIQMASLIPLAEVASKVSQAAYSSIFFNTDPICTIETTASLSELFAVRLRDIRDFGKPVLGPRLSSGDLFPWLYIEGDLTKWVESDLRAAISFLRYEFQAEAIEGRVEDERLHLTLKGRRPECQSGLIADRETVAFWSRVAILPTDTVDNWIMEQTAYA